MQAAVFTNSNKGGRILVGSGAFQYRKRSENNSTSYWTCRQAESKKCKAMAITKIIDENEYLIEEKGEHTHSNSALKRRVREVEKNYVYNAVQNPTITTRTVLGDILLSCGLAVLLLLLFCNICCFVVGCYVTLLLCGLLFCSFCRFVTTAVL